MPAGGAHDSAVPGIFLFILGHQKKHDGKQRHPSFFALPARQSIVNGGTMQVSVKSNISQVIKKLDSIQRKQVPFATAQALNDVAYEAMKEERQQLDKYVDRPTPFTRRGIKYKKATKRDLAAAVFFDKVQAEYMKFMVAGGTRFPHKRAILMSTKNSKLNAYGNMSKAFRSKIFSDKKKYFTGIPNGMADQSAAGVWERYGRVTKKQGQRIRKVASFIGHAGYRPRFPFASIGEKIVFGRFDKHFRARLSRALATAR